MKGERKGGRKEKVKAEEIREKEGHEEKERERK